MSNHLTIRGYYLEIFLTVLFIADLFFKVLPVVPLGILTLLYIIIRCNYWERAFLFLIEFPQAVGTLMGTIGISGAGGLFKVLGVVMVVYMMVKKKKPLKHIDKALLPFGIVMALFTISVLTTSGGNAAGGKLLETFVQGSFCLIAYLIFFNKFRRFDTTRVGVMFILMSAMMLRLSIIADDISGPSGLLDFGFIKTQTTTEDFETFAIGYQNLGFLCVQGMGFFLMSMRNKINFEKIFVLALGLIITLYAGSRQAIVTSIVIVGVWFLQLRGGHRGLRWVLTIVAAFGLYYLSSILLNDEGLLGSVAETGYVEGGGRGPWLLRGVELFLQNPIFGVGYGRYDILGTYGTYPHNMFVEILAETGIVGLVVLLGLALNSALKNKRAFVCILFLFIAIFLRAMASGGLDTNIMVFVLLFCLPALKLKPAGKALKKKVKNAV